jgi:hypothetical protein
MYHFSFRKTTVLHVNFILTGQAKCSTGPNLYHFAALPSVLGFLPLWLTVSLLS